jgi:hypothetical protein
MCLVTDGTWIERRWMTKKGEIGRRSLDLGGGGICLSMCQSRPLLARVP